MTVAPLPPPSTLPRPGGSRHTLCFLALLSLLAVAWGLRSIDQAEPSGLDLLSPIIINFSAGWWATVDARLRRRPIPMLSHAWFFLLAGLLVPAYVIWSRGWRGALWLLAIGFLWQVLATIVQLAGGTAMFGTEWLRAFGQ